MSALYPFDIDLLPPMFHSFDSPILLRAIISARTELAELKGYISGISRPNLFFSLITQEAVASLVIDNINTTVESVLQQDLLPDDKQDIASRNALYYISIIKSGSIRPVEFYLSSYGIRNMHANISSESDSFREYGNYVETPPVGKPFWSPSYKQVPYLVKDWEKFVNSPCSVVDSLVKCILSY